MRPDAWLMFSIEWRSWGTRGALTSPTTLCLLLTCCCVEEEAEAAGEEASGGLEAVEEEEPSEGGEAHRCGVAVGEEDVATT